MKAIMEHCGKMENVEITDDFRRTPLHLAADMGLLNVAKLLLSSFQSDAQQPELNVSSSLREYLLSRDRLGNTCLHYAASRGHYEMVDLILKHAQEIKLNDNDSLGGLLCTTKNFQKCVPLHLAVRRGYAKIATRLLVADAAGQSLKSKNILGNTALADAKAYGHESIREKVLLAKKNGKPLSPSDADVLALEARRAKLVKKSKTLIIRSDVCENHFTCRPSSLFRGFLNSAPPENVNRLKVLTSPDHGGILTATEFSQPEYLWENDPPKAKMSDVLRVHEWHYIRHVQEVCDTLSDHADDVDGIGSLDGDTQISRFTFDAAFTAAGASILGVDKVMESSENSGISKVFCAVRPPGHHAGPTGAVSGSSTDPTIPMKGQSHSHGFCLLNNVAVAAAYAMNVHRNKIKRVAIVDFDVHHGNGTEACVSSVTPTVLEQRLSIGGNDGSGTYAFQGSVKSHKFKPWFDMNDSEAIMFASCQGYGESLPGTGHMFYPGTGATYDTKPPPYSESDGSMEYLNDDSHEFTYRGGSRPYLSGPRIVNVGIKGPKSERSLWKRAWRDKILPAVASHKPDMIFISAGFDAHAKDDMNSGYIGMLECDYEWVTNELVKIANKHSEGRIVSVLEGGYRIQGGLVSPFARSVAAHVRALAEANFKEWSGEEGKFEREREIRIEQEKRRKQQEELLQLLAEKEDIAGQGHVLDSSMDLKMDQPTATDAPAGTSTEGPSSPKRRRRAASSIDYVALNAQLEKEAQNGKAPPAN
jgi:acetoin utilization deacetylase AcuC-like enzyme